MKHPGKSIIIWGAGRIGRGFIGDLFAAAGYHLVLVDRSPKLVARLREAGRYTIVHLQGSERREIEIAGYTAVHTDQEDAIAAAVIRADLLAVTVFPRDFADVARGIVPGLLARRERRPDAPLDLLLCTNVLQPGPQFSAQLAEALPPGARAYAVSHVGVVETLVIRIAPDPPVQVRARDPLQVWTNGYPELPVDQHAFKGSLPAVPGLRPADNMRVEEVRKLYTYNTYHAALAYLGALRGYQWITECMADREVRTLAGNALEEAAGAVGVEYGFTPDEMARWVADVIRHTDNPALSDTVRRYGADPQRKLRREDRLIGPALLARRHARAPTHLVQAIAAALRFEVPGDAGAVYVQERVRVLGVDGAVRELCALSDAEADLIQEIVRAYVDGPAGRADGRIR